MKVISCPYTELCCNGHEVAGVVEVRLLSGLEVDIEQRLPAWLRRGDRWKLAELLADAEREFEAELLAEEGEFACPST